MDSLKQRQNKHNQTRQSPSVLITKRENSLDYGGADAIFRIESESCGMEFRL